DAQLRLAQQGVDQRDVFADRLQTAVVLELSGRRLEAEVEQLFLGLAELREKLLVAQLAQLRRLGTGRHHASPASRLTILHFIVTLWAARVRASRATFSLGYDSSNIARPGLTLATHHSGEPLPEPMRVSAGFLVRGRSG